jgi:hypothetical protein
VGVISAVAAPMKIGFLAMTLPPAINSVWTRVQGFDYTGFPGEYPLLVECN